MPSFKRICEILAARQAFNAGQRVEEIAQLAGRSPATIRKWLAISGAYLPKKN